MCQQPTTMSSEGPSLLEEDELAQEYDENQAEEVQRTRVDEGTVAPMEGSGDPSQGSGDPIQTEVVSPGGTPGRKRFNVDDIVAWLKSYAFFVYSSQALSAWGDRMWSFAVGLYLVEIDDSLRLTATYGLSLTASVFFFGAVVGRAVDKTSRLRAIQISLFLQNSFVTVNAVLMVLLLQYQVKSGAGFVYGLVQLLIILVGVCAKLSSVAEKIAVQKDWIVVIAGENKEYLAAMNASIRRIDLTVNILAPIVVGWIMSFASMKIAGIFIASWNIVSMFVEYFLLWNVYKRVPALAEKKILKRATDQTSSSDGETSTVEGQTQFKKVKWNPFSAIIGWLQTTYDGLKIYYSYQIFWAAFGLACLYMTVMGFDTVTTGYGYALGVPEYILGIFRALGSAAGIIGTIMFVFLRKRVGIVRSGLYALSIQITFLTLCVGSVFAPGSPFDPRFLQTQRMSGNNETCVLVESQDVESHMSAGLFFGGMILSRMGLWAFDLVTSQQIQEAIAEEHRGIFNGIQNSFQGSFDMIHFVLVIGLPCPESFGYLIFASFAFVCTGGVMYAIYSYKQRGHILPHQLKECLPSESSQRSRLRGA